MVLGTTNWSQTNLHGSYIQQVQHKYSLPLVLAFHPNDGDILYLAIELKVLLCKLRSKTVEDLWYSSYDPDTWNDKCNIIFVLLKLANSHSFCSLTEWRLILENRNYCLGFWIMNFLFSCIDHQLPIVI